MPQFVPAELSASTDFLLDGAALCATAKETLAYLNKGSSYDPSVIHEGKVFKLPLERVKATLTFICQHQNQMQDLAFIKRHFDFFRWYPDIEQSPGKTKALRDNLPKGKILMTKYYVHRAKAATKPGSDYPYALYALPKDEALLTLEEAEARPELTRFKYGKQSILKGILANKQVPVLAYLNREDLEAALLQGTIIADFVDSKRQQTFNVHRSNNRPYIKTQSPYQQERFWYFKPVEGIKGYGKDAEYKIKVASQATFAADLEFFGLGKLLMVQYPSGKGKIMSQAGIFADTGGAFKDNYYQVDFLTGSYAGRHAFSQANRHLPDYVAAYFMVVKI